MMAVAITGAHAILFSHDAPADRAFLANVLGLASVDAGEGWLIFALPPAELGVHPAATPAHQLTFMCDDIDATVAELRDRGVEVRGEPEDLGFGGVGTTIVLPGGVEVLVYQASHPSPLDL
jgi:catechol 2,3-dioxygenase-like lactoylglutathione lyase family enzyme